MVEKNSRHTRCILKGEAGIMTSQFGDFYVILAAERSVVTWLEGKGFKVVKWDSRSPGSADIEAKSGKIFSQSWCKGLRAILDLKGVQRRIIVCPSSPVMRTEDGIEVISFRTFADQLSQGLFL